MRRALYGWVWGVGSGGWEMRLGELERVGECRLGFNSHTPLPTPHSPRTYCAGTYVGSCVAESITDAYAVTRPVPLSFERDGVVTSSDPPEFVSVKSCCSALSIGNTCPAGIVTCFVPLAPALPGCGK